MDKEFRRRKFGILLWHHSSFVNVTIHKPVRCFSLHVSEANPAVAIVPLCLGVRLLKEKRPLITVAHCVKAFSRYSCPIWENIHTHCLFDSSYMTAFWQFGQTRSHEHLKSTVWAKLQPVAGVKRRHCLGPPSCVLVSGLTWALTEQFVFDALLCICLWVHQAVQAVLISSELFNVSWFRPEADRSMGSAVLSPSVPETAHWSRERRCRSRILRLASPKPRQVSTGLMAFSELPENWAAPACSLAQSKKSHTSPEILSSSHSLIPAMPLEGDCIQNIRGPLCWFLQNHSITTYVLLSSKIDLISYHRDLPSQQFCPRA